MSSLDPQSYQDEMDKAMEALTAGDMADAVTRAESARRLEPDSADPLFVLGLVALSLNDLGTAIRLLQEAHQVDPDGREIVEVLGALHARAGNLADSVYFTKLAITLDAKPHLARLLPDVLLDFQANVGQARQSAYLVDANIEFFLRRFDKAVDYCRRELALRPNGAAVLQLMGRALLELGRYEEAVQALETSARLTPQDASSFVYLAEGLRKQGRLNPALDCCREAVRLDPKSYPARSELLTTLAFMPLAEWRTYPDEAKAAFAALVPGPRPASPKPVINPTTVEQNRREKIRIGYLINETTITRDIGFFESVLTHQNHGRIYSYVYQQYSRPFLETARLQNKADDWRQVFNIDDETLAHIIRNDALDVLIDVCGAAAGRPALLARRPAPIQISWLGFPQGSLPETVDWLLSNDQWVNLDKRDAGGIPLLWMEGWNIAYAGASVEVEAEKEAPLPALANGTVTFGGVCDPARVAGSMPLWSRVLAALPESRLLLGRALLPDEATQRRIRDMFAANGVTDRISFHQTTELRPAAAFYSAIDLMLDSIPVNGGVETCEALWRGVPFVGCRGDRRAGQVGASILISAGRPEWLADSADAFVDIARSLSADLGRLEQIRKSLPDEFKRSRLCDAKRFVLTFETLMTDLVERARVQEKP